MQFVRTQPSDAVRKNSAINIIPKIGILVTPQKFVMSVPIMPRASSLKQKAYLAHIACQIVSICPEQRNVMEESILPDIMKGFWGAAMDTIHNQKISFEIMWTFLIMALTDDQPPQHYEHASVIRILQDFRTYTMMDGYTAYFLLSAQCGSDMANRVFPQYT